MNDRLPQTAEQSAFIEGVLDLAREGRTGPLLEMIDAGVSIDVANATGDTSLILAAYHERQETVSALLTAGADTGRVNNMGQTALVAAVFRGNKQIVRALLRAGADPERGAHTAREVAEQFGRVEIQMILAEEAPPLPG